MYKFCFKMFDHFNLWKFQGTMALGFSAILSSATQPRQISECCCTIGVYILSRGYERAHKKEKSFC